MSNYFNLTQTGTVGQFPSIKMITTSATLAQVTTPGWIDSQPTTQKLSQNDYILINYGFSAPSTYGTIEWFTVSIATGPAIVTTLVPWVNPANVLLPVVNGHGVVFNGTSGQIEDSGYQPLLSSPVVSGNNAIFNGTLGQIKDGGYQLHGSITSSFAGGSVTFVAAAPGVGFTSIVTANIVASTNAVAIAKLAVGSATITFTFTADPGAGTLVNYIYMTAIA